MIRFRQIFPFVVCLIVGTLDFSFQKVYGQTARPADFGKQWVRSHPLTLMGLTLELSQDFDALEYRAAGLGSVLFWQGDSQIPIAASQAGLPWHFQTVVPYLPVNTALQRFEQFSQQAPGAEAVLAWDEPNRSQMPAAAALVDDFRQSHPNLLVYANAFPMGASSSQLYGGTPPGSYSYTQYTQDFVNIVKPDVLMFDVYPFLGTSGVSGLYFSNLETIRSVALQANIPYWTFVQSYADSASGVRMPSASELRMQVFSSLTYGFTGISYFTYVSAVNDQGGLLDANNNPTPLYYNAASINAEASHLGTSLRFLTSTAVRFIAGRHATTFGSTTNSTPSGMTRWSTGSGGDSHLTSVSVDFSQSANLGLGKDGLIGFFRDDRQEQYFMLTNLYQGTGLSAEQTALTFTIAFDNSIDSLLRLNRLTGQEEVVQLTNHRLTWTLPGGTGDLFKYNNGTSFMVPEPAASTLGIGLLLLGLSGVYLRSLRPSPEPGLQRLCKVASNSEASV